MKLDRHYNVNNTNDSNRNKTKKELIEKKKIHLLCNQILLLLK
jgi:hypothetical protein